MLPDTHHRVARADPAALDPTPFFVMFLALFTCAVSAWAMRKYKISFIPESGIFIVIGVVIGGVNYAARPGVPISAFDPNLFLTGFLPIIIFEAGYSMNKREFFNNIGIINSLAIVGTVISTLVVGYGLYLFEMTGAFELTNSPLAPLLFGTLISAVDPVATLVVFSSLEVDRTLYSIVFGESVMNDAVAVALYQTFSLFLTLDSFGAVDLLEALGLFIAKFVGSFFVGVILAAAVSKLLKHIHVEQPYLVLSMFICAGYIIYNLCEMIKLSGILGVFFAGMVLKHFAFYNVSEEAQSASEDVLKTAAFLAESVIYIYLGMSFFDVALEWNVAFVAIACALCLLGRALNVFPLVALANCFRVKRVSFKFQLLIWHSGLRGAIAFALALLIPSSVAHRDMLVAGTLFIVVITTILIGGSTPAALRFLNIKTGDRVTEEERREFKLRDQQLMMHRSLHGRWHNLDRGYLIPFLSNKDISPSDIQHIREDSNFMTEDSAFLQIDSPPSGANLNERTPLIHNNDKANVAINRENGGTAMYGVIDEEALTPTEQDQK